jgi:hypothetical protein
MLDVREAFRRQYPASSIYHRASPLPLTLLASVRILRTLSVECGSCAHGCALASATERQT